MYNNIIYYDKHWMVDTVTDTTSYRTADSAVSEIENIRYLSMKENDNQYIIQKTDFH